MRKVPCPKINSKILYDEIVAAKGGAVRRGLKGIRGGVFQAYSRYMAAVPEVGTLAPIKTTLKRAVALHHAYDSTTAPLDAIRTKLRGVKEVSRCPFCGLSEAHTLDHYLPKELFPEYSVLVQNLVPCCAPCNTKKRTLILDQNSGVRIFLHPYFDRIPKKQILDVSVDVLPGRLRLRFDLQKPAGISVSNFSRLRSHFWVLGLADRYRIASLDELRGKLGAIVSYYGPSQNYIRVMQELQIEADARSAEYGTNNWRAVLYGRLAKHQQFCDGGFRLLQ